MKQCRLFALPVILSIIAAAVFSACAAAPNPSPGETTNQSESTAAETYLSTETEAYVSTATETETYISSIEETSGTVTPGSSTGTGTSAGSTASAATSKTRPPADSAAPQVKNNTEMRAVWVSYIELDNALKNTSVEQAKAALDKIMDAVKAQGLNTVIMHTRSHSNAYYCSKLFKPAKSAAHLINTGFDPLAYAIDSAHSRGLELHAWINPYRVGTDKSFNLLSEKEIFTAPNTNGTKIYYYVPTSLKAQKLIIDGVSEIVSGYNADGVQFDDYFYPNNLSVIPAGNAAAFEKEEYTAYTAAGGKLDVADWRRAAVSAMVGGVYSRIKSVAKNPNCVFGISPSYHLQRNYTQIYADIALWMSQPGYLDYISPQIYFGFEHKTAPFAAITDLWAGYTRHAGLKLYIGLAMYKSGTVDGGTYEWQTYDDIIARQVGYIRKDDNISGFMVYTYSSLAAYPAEAQNLKKILN